MVAHPEGAYEARTHLLHLRRMVSTSFFRVVAHDASLMQGSEGRRESPRTAATLDVELTRMRRRTEECQPSGDVVGGIVERVVCEVFTACSLVELCVKER